MLARFPNVLISSKYNIFDVLKIDDNFLSSDSIVGAFFSSLETSLSHLGLNPDNTADKGTTTSTIP